MITVSIGVSTYPNDAIDAHGLVRAADKALYEAKGSGKNRIVVAVGKPEKAQAEQSDSE
jgi:diguanylate cyclase (GGDEF)-like protein